MRSFFVLPVIVLWLAALCGGFSAVTRFDVNAGTQKDSPPTWPSQTKLKFDDRTHNLVLSLHPMCSCSNATVTELEQVIAASGNRLKVHALISIPPNSPNEWRSSELVERVRKLPQTEVFLDENCDEAKRYGAATSGDVVLYSTDRQRVFRGGITAARGHAGDSLGKETIIAFVSGKDVESKDTPVFGCRLENEPETRK